MDSQEEMKSVKSHAERGEFLMSSGLLFTSSKVTSGSDLKVCAGNGNH